MSNIVILTGAGISAESGIPTFRDANGLWHGHDIDEVCTLDAFARQPAIVHRFYDERRMALHAAEPNPAHHALVELERNWRGDFLLVTQNVDDLHERAGSVNILHMHGALRSAICGGCFETVYWDGVLPVGSVCPKCAEPSLRPNVVFFQEIPYHQADIAAAIVSADVFVSIGTSGVVYPAAGYVKAARNNGARTIEVNLVGTGNGYFNEVIVGPATEGVWELTRLLL